MWISRSNTPAGSSAASSINERLGRSNNGSQIELPRPAYASSSRGSSRPPSSGGYERATSAERVPSDSRDSSPGRSMGKHSTTRYSNGNIVRNSTTLHALEGLDIPGPSTRMALNAPTIEIPNTATVRYEPLSNDQYSPPSSGNSSGRTSNESSDYSPDGVLRLSRPFEPAYLKPGPGKTHLSVPVDPRMDLDLLQSHRLSHVAETGQLAPRVRKPAQSGDYSLDARAPDEILTNVNGVNYFVPRKTPSPPHENYVVYAKEPTSSQPSTTYTYTTLDPAAAPSTSYKGKEPVSTSTSTSTSTYTPPRLQAYEPRGPHHVYDSEDTSPTQQQPDHYPVPTAQNNNRQSHVLRKVNSGFEILRPGTFAPPTEAELAALEQQQEKRQSRRLQKKRRPSEASRSSRGE